MQFSAVVVQLEKVIMEFVTVYSGEEFILQKIISSIKTYRRSSLDKKNSSHFNNFMNELKQTMTSMEKVKSAVWPEIVAGNLGLISVNEDNDSSNVTSDEAEKFLVMENETAKGSDNLSDEDDLLDEL